MATRILATLGLLVAALLAALVLSGAQTAFLWMPPNIGTAYAVLFATATLVIWWTWQRNAFDTALPRAAASGRVVAMAVIAVSAVALATQYWIPLAGRPALDKGLSGPWGIVSGVIVAGIAGPILEESLFRGWLLERLRNHLSVFMSVVASALFFALAHGDDARAIPHFVAGLVLGAIMISTGRLWLAVVTHGLLNLSGPLWQLPHHFHLDDRIGIAFPIVCVAIAAAATLELQRVLLNTRWSITPSPASRVAPPVTWGLDATR